MFMPLPDQTCVLFQTPVHLHPALQGLGLQYNEQDKVRHVKILTIVYSPDNYVMTDKVTCCFEFLRTKIHVREISIKTTFSPYKMQKLHTLYEMYLNIFILHL